MEGEEAKRQYVALVEKMAAEGWEEYKRGGAAAMPEGVSSMATGAGPVFSSIAVDEEEAAYDKAMEASAEKTLLFLAAEGDLHGAEAALAKGASVDERNHDGLTALHFAADRGNVAMATLLLDAGAPIDAQSSEGDTALHNAVLCEQLEVAKLLVLRGASTTIENADGETPRCLAEGNTDLNKLLGQ